jgi:hypothetical protein
MAGAGIEPALSQAHYQFSTEPKFHRAGIAPWDCSTHSIAQGYALAKEILENFGTHLNIFHLVLVGFLTGELRRLL